VLEVDFRQRQIGHRLLDRRASLRDVAARGVEVRLCDGARVRSFQTVEIAFGTVERCLGLADLCLAHRNPRLVLLGIDGEKQVTRLDQCALFKMHLLDIAADLRAQIDILNRLDPADIGIGRIHFCLLNGLNLDQRRSARSAHHSRHRRPAGRLLRHQGTRHPPQP